MGKYIKVDYWIAQKYQEEDWYKKKCYECFDLYDVGQLSVTFIPEELYIKYFK